VWQVLAMRFLAWSWLYSLERFRIREMEERDRFLCWADLLLRTSEGKLSNAFCLCRRSPQFWM